jgi:hypothetical protein
MFQGLIYSNSMINSQRMINVGNTYLITNGKKGTNAAIAAIPVTIKGSRQAHGYVLNASILNRLPPVLYSICLSFPYVRRFILFIQCNATKKAFPAMNFPAN